MLIASFFFKILKIKNNIVFNIILADVSVNIKSIIRVIVLRVCAALALASAAQAHTYLQQLNATLYGRLRVFQVRGGRRAV